MKETKVIKEGTGIAIIKNYGSNGVLGLIAKHYNAARRHEPLEQAWVVRLPANLTIYADTSSVEDEEIKKDLDAAYEMFGVTLTLRNLSRNDRHQTADTTGTSGIFFIQ